MRARRGLTALSRNNLLIKMSLARSKIVKPREKSQPSDLELRVADAFAELEMNSSDLKVRHSAVESIQRSLFCNFLHLNIHFQCIVLIYIYIFKYFFF